MSLPIGSVQFAEHSTETREWWESRRWRYNVKLAVAGWVAFAFYCLVCSTLLPRVVPAGEIEITLFTTLFQGIGYLVAMGVANVCYLLGPLVESLVNPQRPDSLRQSLYALGTAFSVALPFLIPAYMAWWSITGKPIQP
ncbi:MAG: hypothetical protein KIS61_11415 [Candidatus Eremiobacteraeota bacterium]|nr:hypothetical protein [Candidatus Eremiobacteraeota bacterium]